MGKRNSQSNVIAKERIVAALLELIYEKPVSAITFSELAGRAGVSRMTIYRNYHSIESIFEKELDEIFEEYEEEAPNRDEGVFYDEAHMTHCFSYFYEYKDFLNGLVYCGFGDLFLKKLSRYLFTKWHGRVGEKDVYKLVGFAGFIYSVYLLWEGEAFHVPIEDMAAYISSIFMKKELGKDG